MNENMILRTVPAANDLHKVPGFDPMKYLRKAVNEKGEPVMRLEPRYQRLWFRLACPKGRMLLNPLRVTDQMAIFEAKVFFHREDAAPASSFTATKTAQETAGYIRAAQDEALTVALDNAGFGIQLCDVTHGPGDGKCSPPAPSRSTAVCRKHRRPRFRRNRPRSRRRPPDRARGDARRPPSRFLWPRAHRTPSRFLLSGPQSRSRQQTPPLWRMFLNRLRQRSPRRPLIRPPQSSLTLLRWRKASLCRRHVRRRWMQSRMRTPRHLPASSPRR